MNVRSLKNSTIPILGALLRNPAFQYRDFRLLMCSTTGNYIGYGGEQVIIGLMVFQLTDSSAWVGVALALYFLPLLIFGLAAGVIADRIDRQKLLCIAEVVLASCLAVFALLAGLGVIELWQVLLMTFILGSARALYMPARQSYVYDIVGAELVVTSIGLLTLGIRGGQLLGALIAGSVMHRLGADVALMVLAAIHGINYFVVRQLSSIATEAHSNPVSIVENLRDYVREIRSNRTLLMLIVVTTAVEIFGFSYLTILPELATERFGVGAEGLGLMHALRAAGGFCAGIALASSATVKRRGLLYLVVIYSFGFALIVLAAAPNFVLILLAVLSIAALAAASDILTQSMMQLSVPDRLRGRAMGAWVFAIGSAPLGHLQMGALTAGLGIGTALGINGVALILVGVLTTILAPTLRKL